MVSVPEEDVRERGIYLNVAAPLNDKFAFVNDRLEKYDTRAKHLMDFEIIISASIRESISKSEKWQEMEKDERLKLPTDSNKRLPEDVFRTRLATYVEILRDYDVVLGPFRQDEEME